MNIAIVGAGAMGSLFGGLLAESGNRVTLLDVDAARVAAIQRDGLYLTVRGATRHVSGIAACRPADVAQGPPTPDLLLLFTKTLHTRAALESVRALLGPATHVVTLQNGLGNVEAIAEFVPRDRILVGVTTVAADFLAPGRVLSDGSGSIRLGTADSVARPILCEVVNLFVRAGLRSIADASVWTAIWEKVAFNAAFNSMCAVLGCDVGQIALVPEGPASIVAVIAEVMEVAHACGIPADTARVTAMALDSLTSHAGHHPSMLQDVLAGRRTEIDSINGAVVAAAKQHGLAIPRTEMLLTQVHLMEAARGLH
jgi:2-dehydropantoate 2-reductase